MPLLSLADPELDVTEILQPPTAEAQWHLHWFRRVGDDPFSGSTLYACRCGVVRSGF